MDPLPTSANRWALKEWGAVCAALGAGRRILLLRKGGIAEAGGEFQPERRAFWLLRTAFHQARERLAAEIHEAIVPAEAAQPRAGRLLIAELAVVEQAAYIDDPAKLPALAAEQCLTLAAISERFRYRRPGLWALALRVYRRAEPIEIEETPAIAGCKSWVELAEPLAAASLTPSLDDAEFERRAQAIRASIDGAA